MNLEKDERWPALIQQSGNKCFYIKLWNLGGFEIAISDPRWNADAPWTEIDTALLNYAWAKLLATVNDWGRRGEYCAYGAAVEFARDHPQYQIWFEGALC